MKHDQFFVEVSEWTDDVSTRSPVDALAELVGFLIERGYESLESQVSALLKNFLDESIDQRAILAGSGSQTPRVSVFTTCFKKNDFMLFVDIEEAPRFLNSGSAQQPSAPEVSSDEASEEYELDEDDENITIKHVVEVDLFLTNEGSTIVAREAITDDIMRCFGLTKSKEALVHGATDAWPEVHELREKLVVTKAIDESLFQRLREGAERTILRELKKRGSILERDLQELAPELEPDQIKRTLDYFSGEEYQLVERKFAIVCNATQEIIFLLRSREDIEDARKLECPKCSRSIGGETVLYYYGITENLKMLLDGNRWMPLLVRDALIKAGVPKHDIYTEVKYGEDEIDLLVFYRRRILIMEVKNRPINLNDAYKLSAKTSRIESVITKGRFSDDEYMVRSGFVSTRRILRDRSVRIQFIPFVISTHDIAKDAKELLSETRDSAQILEHSEGKLENVVSNFIKKIDGDELHQRLVDLTATNSSDSVANLAASQIQSGFYTWLRNSTD